MEAEVLEDVGIAPAMQVLEVLRRQVVRIAPRDIGVRQRRTEAIERRDDIRGQPVEGLVSRIGHQREEPAQPGEPDPGQDNRMAACAKILERRHEFGFGHVRSEMKRRLERRVKSVAARGGGMERDFGRAQGADRRRRRNLAAIGIATEPARGQPGQRIVPSGCEIDRVAHGSSSPIAIALGDLHDRKAKPADPPPVFRARSRLSRVRRR